MKILLFDSNALIHRAFHAYPNTLTTKTGEPTNAIFGFSLMLLETITKFKPDYVVCIFDSEEPTHRHLGYEEYKANRKPMDADLKVQFPRIKEIVKAFNIPIFSLAGYEADDIIGTLAKTKMPQELEKIIITGDQDILQLIDDKLNISVYLSGFSFAASKIYIEAVFRERYGFNPPEIVDYKSLVGDASDNIPGVAGIGKKGALDLLNQFKTVSRLYESLDSTEEIWIEKQFSKLKQKLISGKESAFLSKDLATIVTTAPIEFILDDCKVNNYDAELVRKLFLELEFKSLLRKLPEAQAEIETRIIADNITPDYHVLSNPDSCLDYLINVEKSKYFAFDTETDSLDNINAKVLGLSLCIKPGEGKFIPESLLTNKEVKAKLQQIFTLAENGSITAIAHNLKFDLHILLNYGIKIIKTKNFFDTLLAAYLLDGGERESRGLKQLALSKLGMELTPLSDLLGKGKSKITVIEIPLDKLGLYACADADATFRLYELLSSELEENDRLKNLFKTIEIPLIGLLIEMERVGMVIDKDVLIDLKQKTEQKLAEIQIKIFNYVDTPFNIGSPKQVGEVLFKVLAIQGDVDRTIKTKTGAFPTDERTLLNYARDNEIVRDILLYRELSKLLSTYIIGLTKEIDTDDLIHTNYNQAIASTGRLSSSEPNLQNIPVSSDLGKQIRKAFSAGPARKLLAFDYAQQELRLLAHFSQEEKLVEAFSAGVDIHSLTASQILGIELEKVTSEERRIGKTVNFGVIYGISAFGLADRLKVDQKLAAEFIASFFNKYPRIGIYFANLKKEALDQGEIYTIFGRRRDAAGLKSSNFRIRGAVERELINFPLQGSAADIMKLAMLEVQKFILADKDLAKELKIHLQIHDELILSVPANLDHNYYQSLATKISGLMSNVVKLTVPMLVDAEIGANWYDLKPF